MSHESSENGKLPALDWILLPALAVLVLVAAAVVSELAARRILVDAPPRGDVACEVRNDSPMGARATPDSHCWEKLPEGELAEYRFNHCGDREAVECRSAHPGLFRIVMTGSSTGVGRYLPLQSTIAASLSSAIQARVSVPVEIYNASMMQGPLESVQHRFGEVLADKPDMILWIVSPHDLEEARFVPYDPGPQLPGGALSLKRAWYLLKNAYANDSITAMVRTHFDRTRTALALRHFLYQSHSIYMSSSLLRPDTEGGFLKTNMSELWRQRIEDVDADLAENQARAQAAGVPLVVVLTPTRVQAAMISAPETPSGFDPYALDRTLRFIVTRHGATYVDVLTELRAVPDPEQLFFPVDGHPNSQGAQVIAKAIAAGVSINIRGKSRVDGNARTSLTEAAR